MPCSDSSSSIALKLDAHENFHLFEFAKITCGREITAETGYNDYCKGKTLENILSFTFDTLVKTLELKGEEEQFVFYLEWDALRSAIGYYLGVEDSEVDIERCQITSIENSENGIEIALIILPPDQMPKILPCQSWRQLSCVTSLSNNQLTGTNHFNNTVLFN